MKSAIRHRSGARAATVRAVCAAWLRAAALALAGLALPAVAADDAALWQTLTELEAAGATIGEIRIVADDVFDTADPKEDGVLFRVINALHIRTRPHVIRNALLFRSGERLNVRLLEETERVLRSTRFLYEVRYRVLAVHEGVVDLEVATRDTWTLDPGASFSRSGGANASRAGFKELNLLGTGIAVGVGRSRNVDRTSTEYTYQHERAFGTWAAIDASHASNSDGRRNAFSLVRPFYALDARWTAGARLIDDDRIESVYLGGDLASQYRHEERSGRVFGGWSAGLVDGWVRRWTVGVEQQRDRYALLPTGAPPPLLPPDRETVAPFVGFELVEDRFERERNRNQIGRTEFFAVGLRAYVELGWASTAFSSSEEALLYSATVSRGFEPAPDQLVVAAASASGRYGDGGLSEQRLGLQTRWFVPHQGRWVFFTGLTADALVRPLPADTLLLGGEEGLRGYPLRYQSGTRRVLFTAEERYYTDLFIWRLFRLGGAAFVDVGRAWGGSSAPPVNGGWLGDAGIGLRIANSRAAFSNVLHVDLAAPLNATPDIKRVQLLVKTKVSF